METRTITSSDGITLTFDITGTGPAIILLHGMGYTQQNWHDTGYTQLLAQAFTVIVPDTRGETGDSGKPADPSYYTIDRMCNDILEIADTCDFQTFSLVGYSYGGNIGRFLAASSDRVLRFVMLGVNFGPSAEGRFRQWVKEFLNHWPPILEAQRTGTLDLNSLSEEDREDLEAEDINVPLAWLTALLDWGSVEPKDLLCPTLWLYGTENHNCVENMEKYRADLAGASVEVEIINGLNHQQEFSEIDRVYSIIHGFLIN